LKHDLPDLGLSDGAEGVILGVWASPLAMCEIQFADQGYGCRVLLPAHHLSIAAQGGLEVVS